MTSEKRTTFSEGVAQDIAKPDVHLYFLCTKTSESGMAGYYRVFYVNDERIQEATMSIAGLCEEKLYFTDQYHSKLLGIRVNGCGLDRRLVILEALDAALVKHGFAQEGFKHPQACVDAL